eukprot:CAMPEP_0117767570 /NCGR_PEP_ID=MMETSP0947-20121206/21721_1 /TAXON_ID=44440 /ORGANISM="Chattonella subsalsa, Strain CCMP2191" /LENGTH=552 /DNA_ID=CAMNT_0005591311 /DNA_START=47 /DNA_END=1705 /DNA_ORIENTATION=+
MSFWDNEQGEEGDDDAWDSFGQSRVDRLEAEMADLKASSESGSDKSDEDDSDEESGSESENENGIGAPADRDRKHNADPFNPQYNMDSRITTFEDDLTPQTNQVEQNFSSKFLDMLGVKTNRGRMIEYEVTFDRGPVGLRLETDWFGRKACVRGFTKINGEDGPAKKSGLIHIGDVLVAINERNILESPFKDAMQYLKQVSGGQHTLTFKASEAVGDLGNILPDTEVNDARRYIHEAKERFYMPPEQVGDGNDLIYCCVERRRGEHSTAFHLLREDTGEFLCACSVASDRTGVGGQDVFQCKGPFIFHTLKDSHLRPLDRIPKSQDSAVYLGCMLPSLLGLSFVMYNHKVSVQALKGRGTHQDQAANELCLVSYETNVLGRVPNYMKCVIPRPAPAEEGVVQRHPIEKRWGTVKRQRQVGNLGMKIKSAVNDVLNFDKDQDTLNFDRAYAAVEQDNQQDLMIFETKRPVWNEQLMAWTLNFNGRVKIPSKKNFLIQAEVENHLMEQEFGEDVYLRFGKMSKTRFSLDFRHPISPVVALGIAASAFADKILVT